MTEFDIMKACWITSSYLKNRNDFTSSFLHEIAKRLVRCGIEIHIITPMSSGSSVEEIIDGVIIHRFIFFPCKYDKLTYGVGMSTNLKKYFIAKLQLIPYMMICMHSFYKLHKKQQFDLVHAHWAFPSGFIGAILKYLYKIPLVTTLHGTEIFLSDKYKMAKKLMKYCLTCSDVVVANSTYTMQCSRKIIPREYAVIPMGVDTEKYFPLKITDIEQLKEKSGLSGKKIILTICRLITRKGIRYILESLEYIKSQNIHVIIVGSGPEKEMLIKYANELMAKNDGFQIIFKEQVPESELKELHQICDIELLTSITDDFGETEGLGVVLIEGGACGKPLIGSNIGGIPDIIVNEYNGYLISQKDSRAIADKIDYLLENPRVMVDFSKNSRKHITEKFDIENVIENHITIYNNLVSE